MNVHLSDSMTPRRGERNIFNCDSTQSILDTFSQRPGVCTPRLRDISSSLVSVNCNQIRLLRLRTERHQEQERYSDSSHSLPAAQPVQTSKVLREVIDNSSFRVVSRWYGSLKLRYALIPTRSRTRETTGMPSAYFRTDFSL